MYKQAYLLWLIMSLIVSCGEDYTIDNVSDLDVTITDYNPNIDFSKFCTYYMKPDITVPADSTKTITESVKSKIYSLTESNLNALNYVKVTDEANADIVVDFYLATTEHMTINSWYYQGSYWWWGYNDGWSIYSPNLNSYYMYSSGSLVTTLTDKTLIDSEENPSPYWFSLMNGIIEGNVTTNTSRVESSINQSFSQSSYLSQSKNCP